MSSVFVLGSGGFATLGCLRSVRVNAMTAGWTSCAAGHSTHGDRLSSTIVHVDGRVRVHDMIAGERSACIAVSLAILVGHAWLHDVLEALALRVKLVHSFILLLKRLLEVLNHALLDLLQVLDTQLIGLAEAQVLISLAIVHLSHILIVFVAIFPSLLLLGHSQRQAEVSGSPTLL